MRCCSHDRQQSGEVTHQPTGLVLAVCAHCGKIVGVGPRRERDPETPARSDRSLPGVECVQAAFDPADIDDQEEHPEPPSPPLLLGPDQTHAPSVRRWPLVLLLTTDEDYAAKFRSTVEELGYARRVVVTRSADRMTELYDRLLERRVIPSLIVLDNDSPGLDAPLLLSKIRIAESSSAMPPAQAVLVGDERHPLVRSSEASHEHQPVESHPKPGIAPLLALLSPE